MLKARVYSFIVALVLLFAVSFVSRVNLLSSSYVLDDFVLIVNNSFIQSTQNFFVVLNPINFINVLPIKCGARPITISTYILDYSLFNLNPLGYHLSNLLIHCFNVLLVFIFAYFFVNKNKMLFACIVALFFSLHPIQSEAVSIVSFRSNILFVLFSLLAINSIKLVDLFTNKFNISLVYIAIFLLSVLALLSKENAIVLPFIFLLICFFSYKNSNTIKISIISFIIIIWVFVFFWIERFPVPLYYSIYTQIDANLIPLTDIYLYFKILITALFYNIFHVLFPINLSVDYTLNFSIYKIIITIIFVVLSIFFLVYKNKSKHLLFSVLFTIICYLPISNLIPLINTVADRYMYMPMIGISLIFGILVLKIFEINKKLAYIFVSLLMIIFVFISFDRGKTNSNYYSLYVDTNVNAPNNVRAVYNLGVAYFSNNEFDNAISQFEKALKINPFYCTDRNWLLTAMSYEQLGNKEMAFKYYYKAFLLNPLNEENFTKFVSCFNSQQEAKNFILKHLKFIKEDIIKSFEKYGL